MMSHLVRRRAHGKVRTGLIPADPQTVVVCDDIRAGRQNNGCLSGGEQAVKQALRAHRPDSDTVCDQNSTSNDRWGSPIMDLHLLASSVERSLSISNVGWPDWRG